MVARGALIRAGVKWLDFRSCPVNPDVIPLMAYRVHFHSTSLDALDSGMPFRDLMRNATPVGTCSHYMAGHPAMRSLLDDGHPIAGAKHRLVDPHYRYPTELHEILAQLEKLRDTDFKGDEFSEYEIAGFITACKACIETGTVMIVTLR